MTPDVWNNKRRMVPRWRSFRRTIRAAELGSPHKKNVSTVEGALSPALTKRVVQWRNSPNLQTAAELVDNAIVEGREREGLRAATYLLQPNVKTTTAIRDQAQALISRMESAAAARPDQAQRCEDVRYLRNCLRAHPHNALAWVELSLAQTIEGRGHQARRSMLVALQLAPYNRHVLRSAARLFLHLEEPDRAYKLIAENPATRTDPWLIAAEIALADLANRKVQCYKQGVAILESGQLRPHQITELAGAAATAEMVSGNRKKAKKFFSQSMDDPTGNALAQAEWASPYLVTNLVPQTRFSTVIESHEAFAFHLYRIERYKEVIPACQVWATEDPFSIRPYEFGSATAAELDDFETSTVLAQNGLKIRPHAPDLLNTLAFAAANLGDLNKAKRALDKIKNADVVRANIAKANRGLIAYREGHVEEGRVHYLDAIDGFRQLGADRLVASARAYWAREAVRSGTEEAKKLVTAAQDLVLKLKHDRLQRVVDEANKLLTSPDKSDEIKS